MWQPTLASRERILLMGGSGSGKSHAAFSVAERISEGGKTAYVIDNDFSWKRAIEMSGVDPENFEIYEMQPDDWAAFTSALETINQSAERDDLLVVDSMTPTWQAVQDWYVNEIFGKGLDEFFMDMRRGLAGGKSEGLDGWKDWSVINKVYGGMYRMLNRFPGHVVLTAEAEPVTAETDDELKKIYGRVKHRGQKSLPHRVNTIIQTIKTRRGEYQLQTVKDRGREDNEDLRFDEETYGTDFFMAYFVGVAGWKQGG